MTSGAVSERATGPGAGGIQLDTMPRMDVARQLRDARQSAGLSLRELGELAGTSPATLAAYEQGRKTPRLDTLERILAAAGCALELRVSPRRTLAERAAAGQALLDVLELADAFPMQRRGPLTMPIFGREAAG